MGRKLTSVGWVMVVEGIFYEVATSVKSQTRLRHLVHDGIDFEDDGCRCRLDKSTEQPTSKPLATQVGADGKMLHITIGNKLPIGDESDELLVFLISQQSITRVSESNFLLVAGTLLEDGKAGGV